jgi:hypothetical protein
VQNIKSHKTVEQIAKKHRLEVSFVKKQLEMGIPIEHEHTKDKDLATDIALQHLDEIPDYYTRLKKMEASAKKSHKKYKDVVSEKLGLWDRIHQRREKGLPRKKPGEKGYPKTLDIDEGLKQARKNVGASKCWTGKKVGNPPTKIKGGKEVPNCVSVTNEESDLDYQDWDTPVHIKYEQRYCPKCKKDELKHECKYGPKYWDMFSVPIQLKSSAHDPNEPHPGNFPESYDHEYSMARSEISTILSAANRLKKKFKGEGNIEAWVQSKITKAADYLDAAADYVDSGEMKEQVADTDTAADENVGRFDTAMQAIRKKSPKLTDVQKIGALRQAADIRKGVREDITLQDLNGNDFVEIVDVIKPLPIKVKKEEFSNWREELSEDWQKVNRKDKTDGLSQAAVNAYRRENPGSKLQTAVTEKKPKGKRKKRRANFCRRMKGMKSKLTSAKTARDPDSRINKALRRWNCH